MLGGHLAHQRRDVGGRLVAVLLRCLRGLLLRGLLGSGLLLLALRGLVAWGKLALVLLDLLLLLGLLLGLLLVLRLGLGLGLLLGGGRGPVADDRQLGAHLDGLVLADLDLLERAGDRRGDLGVDLVGGDLEQRLVDRDLVTDLLQPAGDGALGDRLAQRGQGDRRTAAATTTAARRLLLGRGLLGGLLGGGGLLLLDLLGLLLGLLLLDVLAATGGVRGLLGLLRTRVVGAAGLGLVTDHRQHGADLDGVVLVDLDLHQRAGHGGGDLGVDLVGGDLEQRLVDRDLVTDLLQPAGDGALGDRLAQRGQGDRRTAAATTTAARRLLLGRGLLGGLLGGGGLLLLDLLGLLLGLLLLDVLAATGGVRGLLGLLRTRVVGAAGLGLVTDHRQHGADLDGVVLVDLDLHQRAGHGGGDLGVDLVGGDLQERLVDRHLVADLLEPAGDGAFGDGLAERGEGDFGGQCSSFCWRTGWSCRGQEWACNGLPARARWASPSASFWVGWAWTRGATSSAWASQP